MHDSRRRVPQQATTRAAAPVVVTCNRPIIALVSMPRYRVYSAVDAWWSKVLLAVAMIHTVAVFPTTAAQEEATTTGGGNISIGPTPLISGSTKEEPAQTRQPTFVDAEGCMCVGRSVAAGEPPSTLCAGLVEPACMALDKAGRCIWGGPSCLRPASEAYECLDPLADNFVEVSELFCVCILVFHACVQHMTHLRRADGLRQEFTTRRRAAITEFHAYPWLARRAE